MGSKMEEISGKSYLFLCDGIESMVISAWTEGIIGLVKKKKPAPTG